VKADTVPAESWGYFKVPASWPGVTDYMQKDSQTVFRNPEWKTTAFGGIDAAWYQREITVPPEWTGRRIALSAEYLNSSATVFIDGTKAGDIQFPAGELDLAGRCKPGATHVLSVFVVALPMKGVMLAYTDSAAAREVKGKVARRGLCGDVWLASTPSGPRLGSVKVDTSVRKKEINCSIGAEGLAAGVSYTLRARIMEGGRTTKEFTSPRFQASDLKEGRIEFASQWIPEKLWDTHTPQNVQAMEVSLIDPGRQGSGHRIDAVRISRILDRGPRFHPERQAHSTLRRAAG
jgi:beta-galactosidase